MMETWAEMFPEGRTIFLEGVDDEDETLDCIRTLVQEFEQVGRNANVHISVRVHVPVEAPAKDEDAIRALARCGYKGIDVTVECPAEMLDRLYLGEGFELPHGASFGS